MKELEEDKVESLRWKRIAKTKAKLEDASGKGDLFGLERQPSNPQEKFEIIKMQHMDNIKQLEVENKTLKVELAKTKEELAIKNGKVKSLRNPYQNGRTIRGNS
jgi:hypothetical protein